MAVETRALLCSVPFMVRPADELETTRAELAAMEDEPPLSAEASGNWSNPHQGLNAQLRAYLLGLLSIRIGNTEQALERVGLKSRMHHYPTQLSGGQQQRVAISRAIVGSPRLLLADEPTGNLDSKMGEEIMQILEGYNRDAGVTVIMVTHDQRLAERTERTVRLFDGRQVH